VKNENPEHIAALIERIGRLISADAHAEGLQPVQWEALRYLTRANRFSKTAAALAAYLGLTKGTVSQTLKALEAKGFLCKDVDVKDRRSNRLSLTPKAQRLMRHDPLFGTQLAIDSLPVSTRRWLARGLEALLSNRLSARNRQPFGQCRDCRYFGRNHPYGRPHFCQLLREKLSASEAEAICFEQIPKR
jgi:DNA-binding MarR family transcriptional regulator